MDLSPIYKAVAGGLVTAVVAVFARYGLPAAPEVVSALGVVVTAVVAYIAGHLAVYFAPKNRPKI